MESLLRGLSPVGSKFPSRHDRPVYGCYGNRVPNVRRCGHWPARNYRQRRRHDQWFFGPRIQTWRPRLRINGGLRWDFSGVIGEKNNLGSECVMSAGPTCTLTQLGTGGLSSGLYNPDYKNFAPRLSIAYDPFGSGKTVIRAGWGIFY